MERHARFLTTMVLAGLMQPVWATNGEPDFTHTNVGAIMIPIVPGGPSLPGYTTGQYVPGASGTLIHERVFLTAGHVTESQIELTASGLIPLDLVYITFDRDPSGVMLGGPIPPTWRPVAEVITHTGYVDMPRRNDTGVFILADAVTDIAPASLPTETIFGIDNNDFLYAAMFTVVGYGAGVEFAPGDLSFIPPPNGPPPPFQFVFDDLTRNFAHLRYNAEFAGFAVFLTHVDASDATQDQGAGPGDSGGPIFLSEPDGSETLAATVVGPVSSPNFFRAQRIDLPQILDFIDAVLASLGG